MTDESGEPVERWREHMDLGHDICMGCGVCITCGDGHFLTCHIGNPQNVVPDDEHRAKGHVPCPTCGVCMSCKTPHRDWCPMPDLRDMEAPPSPEHIASVCCIGMGARTCRYLTRSAKRSWMCAKGSYLQPMLDDNFGLLRPLSVARGDNCTGPPSFTATEENRPSVIIPNLCRRHSYDFIVRRMKLKARDRWMMWDITLRIMIFRGLVSDPRIVARSGGDAGVLSLILAEIGCVACYGDSLYYKRAVRVCRKGIEHAVNVAHGRVSDEGFETNAPAYKVKVTDAKHPPTKE